jgi:hypothetical protein
MTGPGSILGCGFLALPGVLIYLEVRTAVGPDMKLLFIRHELLIVTLLNLLSISLGGIVIGAVGAWLKRFKTEFASTEEDIGDLK